MPHVHYALRCVGKQIIYEENAYYLLKSPLDHILSQAHNACRGHTRRLRYAIMKSILLRTLSVDWRLMIDTINLRRLTYFGSVCVFMLRESPTAIATVHFDKHVDS